MRIRLRLGDGNLKTATVHVGFHKTGSTFIQSVAHKNFRSLLENNLYFRREIDYPKTGVA